MMVGEVVGLMLVCSQGIFVDFSPSLFQLQLTVPSMMLTAVTRPRLTFCEKLRWGSIPDPHWRF